ncbi:MAG: alpha-galactosidase [Clostridia bacterium]|nr:alpha-galactosidase [Clostridia bacterium]
MIACTDGVFRLSTAHTSYWFQTTAFGHLEHIYYGARLSDSDAIEPLLFKRTAEVGASVLYDPADNLYCLDVLPLEWSTTGKGDFRHAPMEGKMPDGSFVCDLTYVSHSITADAAPMRALPCAQGEAETLCVVLQDALLQIELRLYYTVFAACDVICRRAVLQNDNEAALSLRSLMSFMLDLPDENYSLLTLSGGWIKEAHRNDAPLPYGLFVSESTTGASSNRRNSAFALYKPGCTEEYGSVYGFNLIYSGNHYAGIERGEGGLVRVMQGISPHCFDWTLHHGDSFETPQAVLTFSSEGFNGMRSHLHDFVLSHILPEAWRDRERPVLYNNWEACFFQFSQGRLLSLAKQAKRLGAELFVLDDGWFGARNSDKAGLGDYNVNKKKLPHGLDALAKRINRLGIAFGLWLEPEMCNPDSDLYRAHPEYAVQIPGRTPALGRNQLVLDLTSASVRDYIVTSVRGVLQSANITYVKWDMNRHISDMYGRGLENQGEFYHRYILGLYDVLRRIFGDRPDILLESCASGGDRFDLGMLCFSPQIWASDDTDPVERLKIQGGLSYFYPPSVMGAHVSLAPHQQTLRQTPLNTRFCVSCFGALGYELDLRYLTRAEKAEIKKQIEFYKRHRRTLQFGRFRVLDGRKPHQAHWQVTAREGTEVIAGFFQSGTGAAQNGDVLPLTDLDESARYRVETRPQPLFISGFGALVNHILPVRLHPNGFLLRTANKLYTLPDCVERYAGTGKLLMQGIRLNTPFMGTNYTADTRLLGDYGANLYVITKE